MLTTTFKTHQDAIYVADMEGAQKKNVKFYHTLSGLVVCVDTITKEYVRKHLPSEIVQEAKKDGRSVHFASLVDFCHLEHTELAKHLQTYKGTVVLWAERATPQTKGEQGASASHMAATGLLDDSLAWRAKPTTRYQPRRRCTCREAPRLWRLPRKERPHMWTRLPPSRSRTSGRRLENQERNLQEVPLKQN